MKAPPTSTSGAQALRAALRRVARERPRAVPPESDRPAPESDWERMAEKRLHKIERQLANQNRLLLVTFVSILADVMLGLAR